MISSELLKDIIKSNEEFILKDMSGIVPRIDILKTIKPASENVHKVNIIHGLTTPHC